MRVLAPPQLLALVEHRLRRVGLDDAVDRLHPLGPLAERLARGERILQLLVTEETRRFEIDADRLAGADAAALDHLRGIDLHHAGL